MSVQLDPVRDMSIVLEREIAEQEKTLRRAPAALGAPCAAAAHVVARRRRDLQLADHPAAGGLAQPRRRLEDLRRRRQRVRRPARRVRRVARRARPSRDRRGGAAPRSRAAPTSPSRPRTPPSVAEELARRFGLPLWRFANSGTEATMDAIHLMRGDHRPRPDHQGRGLLPRPPRLGAGVGRARGGRGRRRAPARTSVPSSSGIPRAITDLTLIVGFNDLPGSPRCSRTTTARVAGMIVEPIMMNAGIIPPEPGYLAGLKDLLHAHGALLDLRRGQDRPDRGPVRRHRGRRRDAGHHLPRQGDRRRRRRLPRSAAPPRSWRTSPTVTTRWSALSTATRWRWRRPGRC